jgi:protein arginine phosphatase
MKRVLFVCGGNTCRSPMAAGLAKHSVPGLEASSAGVTPGDALAANAAAVITERTGVAPDYQETVNLVETNPYDYDVIVAMDHIVAAEVIRWVPPTVPVLVWDVKDPYLGPLDEYRQRAHQIEQLVAATFTVQGPREHIGQGSDAPPLSPLEKLDVDLQRWRAQLPQVAPTHCNGIAASAARELERLLKDLLTDRLGRASCSPEELLAAIKYQGQVKEVGKLPIGKVIDGIAWLAKRDPELGFGWRTDAGKAARMFVYVRNAEIHDADGASIVQGTQKLLHLVGTVVGDPALRKLFDDAARLNR